MTVEKTGDLIDVGRWVNEVNTSMHGGIALPKVGRASSGLFQSLGMPKRDDRIGVGMDQEDRTSDFAYLVDGPCRVDIAAEPVFPEPFCHGQKKYGEMRLRRPVHLDQRCEISEAAVRHDGSNSRVLRGGTDTGGRSHRHSEHPDPPQSQSSGHEPVDRTADVASLRLPEPEAGCANFVRGPEGRSSAPRSLGGSARLQGRETRRDAVAWVPVKLVGAAGIFAVHKYDRPTTRSGRDKPAGDLDTVALGREANVFKCNAEVARCLPTDTGCRCGVVSQWAAKIDMAARREPKLRSLPQRPAMPTS